MLLLLFGGIHYQAAVDSPTCSVSSEQVTVVQHHIAGVDVASVSISSQQVVVVYHQCAEISGSAISSYSEEVALVHHQRAGVSDSVIGLLSEAVALCHHQVAEIPDASIAIISDSPFLRMHQIAEIADSIISVLYDTITVHQLHRVLTSGALSSVSSDEVFIHQVHKVLTNDSVIGVRSWLELVAEIDDSLVSIMVPYEPTTVQKDPRDVSWTETGDGSAVWTPRDELASEWTQRSDNDVEWHGNNKTAFGCVDIELPFDAVMEHFTVTVRGATVSVLDAGTIVVGNQVDIACSIIPDSGYKIVGGYLASECDRYTFGTTQDGAFSSTLYLDAETSSAFDFIVRVAIPADAIEGEYDTPEIGLMDFKVVSV